MTASRTKSDAVMSYFAAAAASAALSAEVISTFSCVSRFGEVRAVLKMLMAGF
ncbi:MAG: hypothetical protein IH966_03865 [Gemmatimonadetes bacterium]|nr:hypothetical protein [Gemmatimonadota bacterium]